MHLLQQAVETITIGVSSSVGNGSIGLSPAVCITKTIYSCTDVLIAGHHLSGWYLDESYCDNMIDQSLL